MAGSIETPQDGQAGNSKSLLEFHAQTDAFVTYAVAVVTVAASAVAVGVAVVFDETQVVVTVEFEDEAFAGTDDFAALLNTAAVKVVVEDYFDVRAVVVLASFAGVEILVLQALLTAVYVKIQIHVGVVGDGEVVVVARTVAAVIVIVVVTVVVAVVVVVVVALGANGGVGANKDFGLIVLAGVGGSGSETNNTGQK